MISVSHRALKTLPLSLLVAVLAATLLTLGPTPTAAATTNPVTPGNFKGYGFDQCLAPTQSAMDAWLNSSPFLAAGIYISGNSRACRDQPNLTPEWVSTQLRKGWKLLPITLGPQASCSDRFPRYSDDPTIHPRAGANGNYPRARRQARNEAAKAAEEAKRLGIPAGSTLWYDLEAFDISIRRCRESALHFLSAWTTRLHALDYVSGVYSSAGSGILILDRARQNRPDAFDLPDMIWIARWDGIANTSTTYIPETGWRPGGRMKQYQGGHYETWGRVTINIDRNYLNLGKGAFAPAESHCRDTNIGFAKYPAINVPTATWKPSAPLVQALQCMLRERDIYAGRLNGRYTQVTRDAVHNWQTSRGFAARDYFGTRDWVALHMDNDNRVLKVGSAGSAVRRLQRALHAVGSSKVAITGVFNVGTANAVSAYQRRVGLKPTGILNSRTNARMDVGAD